MKHLIRIMAMALLLTHPAVTSVAQEAKHDSMPPVQEVADSTYERLYKDFRQCKTFVLHISYGHNLFAGMPDDKFCQWLEFQEGEAVDSAYLATVLADYEEALFGTGTFRRELAEEGDEAGKAKKPTPYTIELQVQRITRKAGITASAVIYSPDAIPFAYIDAAVENGRWNKFAVLLAENGEKQAKALKKELTLLRDPFARNELFSLPTDSQTGNERKAKGQLLIRSKGTTDDAEFTINPFQ